MVAEAITFIAGMALAYSAACRAIGHMSMETIPTIRWAIAMQGMCGLGMAVIPLFRPDLMAASAAALVLSSAVVQIVTARYWPRGNTPPQFRRQHTQAQTFQHAGSKGK